MKESRINNIFKFTSIGAFIIIIVVSGLLIFYYSALKNNDLVNQRINNATRIINTLVTSLNNLNVIIIEEDYKSIDEFSNSDKIFQEIKNYNKQLNLFLSEVGEFGFDYTDAGMEAYPELLFETGSERTYITEIGDKAREINAFLAKENEKIKSLSSFITISAFVMLVIILMVLLISFYFQERHFKTVDKTIKNMNAMVDGEQIEFSENTRKSDSELLKRLREIDKKITFQNELLNYDSFGTLETILPEMYPILKKQIDIQRLAVAFLDNGNFLIAETLISEKKEVALGSGFREHINCTTLANLKSDNDVRLINDLEQHYNEVHKSQATKLILEEGHQSSITAPMYTESGLLGFLFVNNVKKNAYSEKDIQIVKQFTKILKSEIYNSYLMQELVAKTSEAFANLVEKKDSETGNHLIRVASYSQMIARKMMETDKRITPKMIREIFWFAPLHDIGKVGIPDEILLKPGKLTVEEFAHMKEHVNIGVQVIHKMNTTLIENTNIDFLDTCLKIISEHHEKWDGSGYPNGKKGEEISIPGRIIAVADVFDALISKRVYKKAFTLEKALGIIKEGRGAHFCPDVVDIFLDSKEEILQIIEKNKD